MIIIKKEPITFIRNKPISKDIDIDGNFELKEIQTLESISLIKKHSKINKISKSKIVNQEKIPIIYNKPNAKEEGNEGDNININEISENISILFSPIKIEKRHFY